MRHRTSALFAGTVLITGCVGAPSFPISREPVPAETSGSANAPAASALERQIHDLINDRRAARGLAPLAWDARIAEIARRHSQAMASGSRPFGHDGFDERARAVRALTTVRSMAENVAYDSREGSGLAAHVVEGWISSAGHRQNIEGAYDRTGIGVAEGPDGMRYFTQIFVNGG